MNTDRSNVYFYVACKLKLGGGTLYPRYILNFWHRKYNEQIFSEFGIYSAILIKFYDICLQHQIFYTQTISFIIVKFQSTEQISTLLVCWSIDTFASQPGHAAPRRMCAYRQFSTLTNRLIEIQNSSTPLKFFKILPVF